MELIKVFKNGLYLIRTEHAACIVDKKTYDTLEETEVVKNKNKKEVLRYE